MIPAEFEYRRAGSVEEAIELLGADEDAKVLAGGHSLIPAMKLRIARPSHARRHRQAERPALRARGGRSHRRRSPDAPCRARCRPDPRGVLRRARTRGRRGRRPAGAPPRDDRGLRLARRSRLRSRDRAEGARRRARRARRGRRADACGGRVLHRSLRERTRARRAARRDSRAEGRERGVSQVLAAYAGLGDGRRRGGRGRRAQSQVALCQHGPTPLRASAVEEALAGGASAADAAVHAAEGADPPSDVSASSEYRAHLAQVLVRRALEQL